MSGMVLHLLRVTIEALSPLSLGSGDVIEVTHRRRGENGAGPLPKTQDVTALVRDANGLPTIPGSTLQGVLRHHYAAAHGEIRAKKLFGYAAGTAGEAGRLFVGFGAVHDHRDHAVTDLIVDPAAFRLDAILPRLRNAEPLLRDHVSLNERHVADGRKKFDRRAVPVGTRFSIELSLWGTSDEATSDKAALESIVRLFSHPAFRLGGAGRHGYGRIVPRRASYACPDLGDPIALRKLRDQAPSVALPQNILSDSAIFDQVITLKLRLTPINPWRIGGDAAYLTEHTLGVRLAEGGTPHPVHPTANPRAQRDQENVATILREPVIVWVNRRAELRLPGQTSPFDTGLPNGVAFAVPGSAIKGPLAHRTLFHWNRRDASRMIDVDQWLAWDDLTRQAELAERVTRPESLGYLFGAAKERDSDAGRAGRVFTDDGVVSDVRAVQAVDHVVIDRFTGGVIPGLLYAEEVLVGGSVETTLTILPPPPDSGSAEWPADIRDAFLSAMRDMCRGRLAIGAKSLGFCTGDVAAWGGDIALIPAWKNAWEALITPSAQKDAA